MSSVNGSPEYATASAFRRAVEDRLKSEAKERGRNQNEVRRQFLFQRFLALIFADADSKWVLKGGASLLMRLADARHSQDLDLLRLDELDPDAAMDELRALTAPRPGDHLTFVVEDAVTYSTVNPVITINVTAYIGAKYDSFSIDLATELHLLAVPERIRPTSVVEVPGLATMPEIILYPLTDQIADKLCAMYQLYGEMQNPSSRYRDLIDLVLIVTTSAFDAGPVIEALASEAKRRDMSLPGSLASPHPTWTTGYASYARKTQLDERFHDLQVALDAAGACMNPLLSGERTQGSWDHVVGWID